MATLIRCKGCRDFFPKALPECPDCGTARTPVNVALESQRWASNLNMQADRAVRTG